VEQLRVVAEAAHAGGVPVAAHAHGAQGALDAVRAGFDTLEHGGFWTQDSAVISPADVEALLRAGTYVVTTPAGRGIPDPALLPPALAARLPAVQQVLGAMRAAGVPLAYASDAGIAPVKQHDVLAHSLPRALHQGFTTEAALHAMTAAAAEACGVGTQKGRVARGWDADLLAVDGDLRADPDALGRTHTVMRAGVVVRTAPAGAAPRHDEAPLRA
jgi:imidazolonepropionase-like amidohydrolase